jgi:hypothetical protein
MESNMRGERSVALYNELKSSWEREKYIDICTFEERKGIGWWKMGIWRLKGMKGNTALYSFCSLLLYCIFVLMFFFFLFLFLSSVCVFFFVFVY